MLTLIPMLEFPRIYISFLKLWTTIFELPGRRGAFAPTGGENMSPHCRPIGRQRGWMRKSRGVEKLLQKIMEKVKDLETYSWRFELRWHMTLPKKGGYKNQFFDFNKHAGEGKICNLPRELEHENCGCRCIYYKNSPNSKLGILPKQEGHSIAFTRVRHTDWWDGWYMALSCSNLLWHTVTIFLFKVMDFLNRKDTNVCKHVQVFGQGLQCSPLYKAQIISNILVPHTCPPSPLEVTRKYKEMECCDTSNANIDTYIYCIPFIDVPFRSTWMM